VTCTACRWKTVGVCGQRQHSASSKCATVTRSGQHTDVVDDMLIANIAETSGIVAFDVQDGHVGGKRPTRAPLLIPAVPRSTGSRASLCDPLECACRSPADGTVLFRFPFAKVRPSMRRRLWFSRILFLSSSYGVGGIWPACFRQVRRRSGQ